MDNMTPATPNGSVQVGDLAPNFNLPSQTGEQVNLDSFRGNWTVVYFYPSDYTPGCTKEACSFRDSFEDFTDVGAVVLGISKDSVESHAEFAAKYRLPFTLLADEGAKVAAAWGVGKSLGIIPGRITYVIDPKGVVRMKFSSQMRATKHKDEALATIRSGA